MDQDKVNELSVKYQALVARCWQDEDYKKSFIDDPAKILEQEGIDFDKGKKYEVIEAGKFALYIVLPYEGGRESLQTLYMNLNSLFDRNNNGQIIKPGCELRIIQNTPDTDYLIIPCPPALYTENEKIKLSNTNGIISVESDVTAIAEQTAVMVSTVAEAAQAATTLFVVCQGFIVVI